MSLLNLLEEFIMFEKIRKMKNKKGSPWLSSSSFWSSWPSLPLC